jgi:energy-coupling factor transporter transmembrane protein EcfT
MENEKNINTTGGMSFGGVLTLIFIVLKLVGVIHWSWIWVLSPLWISLGLIIILVLIVVIARIITSDTHSADVHISLNKERNN